MFDLWRGNALNVIRGFPTALSIRIHCGFASSVNCTSVVPLRAMNFASKDAFAKAMTRRGTPLTWASHALAGGLAGACTLLLVYPLNIGAPKVVLVAEYMRREAEREAAATASAAGTGAGSSASSLSRLGASLVNRARDRWGGIGASLPSVVAYRAAYFGVFDTLMDNAASAHSPAAVSRVVTTLASAWVAVVTAKFVAAPFDAVWRRIVLHSDRVVSQGMKVRAWDLERPPFSRASLPPSGRKIHHHPDRLP